VVVVVGEFSYGVSPSFGVSLPSGVFPLTPPLMDMLAFAAISVNFYKIFPNSLKTFFASKLIFIGIVFFSII
jgi:hypothetical protein